MQFQPNFVEHRLDGIRTLPSVAMKIIVCESESINKKEEEERKKNNEISLTRSRSIVPLMIVIYHTQWPKIQFVRLHR